jgi:hypothetical protein
MVVTVVTTGVYVTYELFRGDTSCGLVIRLLCFDVVIANLRVPIMMLNGI